ncbi:hypothetical protein [Desulfobotulus mexicanus]|uniref:Fibronectin type III domain-containing protein n=1 Tax=Desulfobotulus mexicanus TaxID=2586642 RepID=A0A5S5MF57_9BACT|nr:hypothetical protein [Desulfobotulus mexicanus]TYT74265.1 hypothetical protein FIM25_10875 [Desulfobotulus mexicanus]
MQCFKNKGADKIILCLLLLFVAVACGLKAPPMPPGENMPEAPLSFKVRPETGSFVLSWEIEGQRPAGFRIYRAAMREDGCRDCPLSYTLLAVLGPEARRYADKADTARVFVYEIRPFMRGGAEGPPARLQTHAGEEDHP